MGTTQEKKTYRQKRAERKQRKAELKQRKAELKQKNGDRKQYWFVVRELTAREIKRKYSRSALGILWSVLNPLLSMVIISLIFTQLFQRTIENFPIYYLCGSLLWQMFTTSTRSAMTSIVDNKLLLLRIKFPMHIFIVSRVYTALVNLGYSLIAFVAMLIFFRIQPSWAMFFIPVIIILLLIFSLGISDVLAIAYVFFGDVKHLYGVILTLWMYCSAIFYPVDALSGFIRIVIENNPIYAYIASFRAIILYHQMPSTAQVIRMVAWAAVSYFIGQHVFERNKNKVMQKL